MLHILKFKFAKLDLKSGLNGTLIQLYMVKKFSVLSKTPDSLFEYFFGIS
jgi:hypothetical protein